MVADDIMGTPRCPRFAGNVGEWEGGARRQGRRIGCPRSRRIGPRPLGLCCSTGISMKNLKSQYVITPMNFSSDYKFENIICFVCSTVPC